MAQKKGDILESLISQLERKQADISCFLDLLDDYMALYDIKKKLKSDIKTTSVTSIKKCYLLGNYYYLTGGNSNIINVFEEKNNEESILSLIL